MISYEAKVSTPSNYYLYTASLQAKKTFFYPLCIGHFYYEPGYHLCRNNYDSFLMMFIKKGECTVCINSETYKVREKQIVLLDCYKSHTYYTETGWEAEWIHFDGLLARNYFDLITAQSHFIFSLKDSFIFEKYLHKLYLIFHLGTSIKEALVSQYITTLLTELVIYKDYESQLLSTSDVIEKITTYIHDHFHENLTLKLLAQKATLSPYYFTRVFKKKTGFTPHEYVIATRINAAKFLLKNTTLSIKQISINCGFASESNFCATFKKICLLTPTEYRMRLTSKHNF